jgi:hypothetical protein
MISSAVILPFLFARYSLVFKSPFDGEYQKTLSSSSAFMMSSFPQAGNVSHF